MTRRETVDRLKAGETKFLKAFTADVKAVDGEEGVFRFVITTGAVDRDRDTIDPKGWHLTSFRQNPVVLWAHDYSSPPVATARSVVLDGDSLVSEAKFVDASIYPFAGVIAGLVKIGALKATSVGFQPTKWAYNEERRGVDFQEQDLLEYSIVPVPANPGALIEARAAGIDVEPLREWAARTLQRLGGFGSRAEWVIPIKFRPVLVDLESRGITPPNPSSDTADEGTAWSAPTLADFTQENWADLSDADKRKIARHFAWAASMPPETFDDLKLPHHRTSDDAAVWRGVAAAMGALLGARGGVDIPEGDRKAVYNHLAAHYRQWDKEPPEFRIQSTAEVMAILAEAEPKTGPRFEVEDEIDLAAIPGNPDELNGLTAEDVVAAMRAVVASETEAGMSRAMAAALGRVD